MATTEEIRQRVELADTARSARRAAAAQQVGELAQRRAAVVEQLEDVERQLGEVLAAAHDVLDIDELAQFTDVKAADLTQWFARRKPARTKRTKQAGGVSSTPGHTSRGARRSSVSGAPRPGRAVTRSEPVLPRGSTADAPERVTAEVP